MAIAAYDTPVTTGVSEDTANVAEALLASVVLVRTRGGAGSGVIWAPDGLIVTNSHVVHDDTADIVFHDGTKLAARLIARDPQHDLAALRVEAHDLPAIKVGDSSRVLVGQLVLAVGNPMGMRGVVTAGIVTGAGQITGEGRTRLQDLIQADVALAPGNSGGPLADAEGRVLGINAMIGANGIALAIPSATVQAFLAPQQRNHPYLGIAGVDVQVRGAGPRRGGVLLTSIEEGSPADRCGLLQGDILLSFDDQDVQSADDLLRHLAAWQVETPVRLRVQRGAQPREFTFIPTLKNEA
jgi:S1-C subfamily serine protease